MQICYSIPGVSQTDNQGLSNSCPPRSKVPSIMRGIGSRVKGHRSVKQYAGGPVRKLTPNRSVLTPSPLTWSGKLNLNNIFPRDAVLLKDFSQGLLARGIPPAKPSPRLQVEPRLHPYPASFLRQISPFGFKLFPGYRRLIMRGQIMRHLFLHSFEDGLQEGCYGSKRSPSSALTLLKNSHIAQSLIFSANDSWGLSSQNVPTTFQQHLPACRPLFLPQWRPSTATGQTPFSSVADPPDARPQFITSQQLSMRWPDFSSHSRHCDAEVTSTSKISDHLIPSSRKIVSSTRGCGASHSQYRRPNSRLNSDICQSARGSFEISVHLDSSSTLSRWVSLCMVRYLGMAASSLWKCGGEVSWGTILFCDRIALKCCKFALAWAMPIHYDYHCRRKWNHRDASTGSVRECGAAHHRNGQFPFSESRIWECVTAS